MSTNIELDPWDLGSSQASPAPLPADEQQGSLGESPVAPASQPAPVPTVAGLTPTASRTLADLLELGSERPVSPPDLPDQLKEFISTRTKGSLETWPERHLWVSKSSLMTMARCEGAFKASKESPWAGLVLPVAVGQVAHRAIQVSYTHPNLSVESYVRAAITAQCDSDQPFNEFWSGASIAVQSDLITQAVSKTTAFLDSWPALSPEWSPRFEEGMTARVGKLTMSVRPDLVLGRPRPDLRQTMLLCDFKTGDLKEEHEREAYVYALVSTLRNGVAPFKSVVFSLASGEWVAPEITPDTLFSTAEFVADSAARMVDVLLERSEPVLTVGPGCAWCVKSTVCPAYLSSKAPAPVDDTE